jgi:serine/threonine protein kinase
MQACTALELIRIASNRFTTLPDWLLKLPHLSWLACADNPFSDISATSALKNQKEIHREISWSQLAVENKLGEGASGVIYQASLLSETTKQEVAVKLFKGTITSDGSPYSEMAANMNAGSHPNLINIKGKIVDHPEGTPGLVMSLINSSYRNLAGPPSLESCTRDIYASETTFTLQTALEIALGITKAARHLHENGVLHGDLYAHNILHDDTGRCLLGDFGAASIYSPENQSQAIALEQIEVRAFGCLLEELLERCITSHQSQKTRTALWNLQLRCVQGERAARPLFAEIEQCLMIFKTQIHNEKLTSGNRQVNNPA